MGKDKEQAGGVGHISEESIEHWSWIINAVFRAEHEIIVHDGWDKKLKSAKGTDHVEQTAHEYVRAIAVELLSNGMDFEDDEP